MLYWMCQIPFILGFIGISICSIMGLHDYDPEKAGLVINLGVFSVYLFFSSSILAFFFQQSGTLEIIRGLIILVVTLGYTAVLARYCDTIGNRIILLQAMGLAALVLTVVSRLWNSSQNSIKWDAKKHAEFFE